MSEICRVYYKNKFEKLAHLVGFIIRIYHDARSAERHNQGYLYRANVELRSTALTAVQGTLSSSNRHVILCCFM